VDEETRSYLDGLIEKVDERDAKLFARLGAMQEETRRYNDALLERHVTITQHLIDAMQAGFASLQAEIADQREQIQANTAAVLRLLDRFGPEPQG
jgi:hypothetical protein